MKRLYSFVLMLIMVLSMSTTVFAASSKSYQLDDLGMSIDIPSEYVTFTRNISDNDPNLATYGLNKKDLSDLMKSGNIYLNAWDKDVTFEIVVTMIDSTITDFNLMSDTMLNCSHIEFVMEFLRNNTTEIRNMKQYLLAVLFNAPTTISNHYTAQVNHDMYAGGW